MNLIQKVSNTIKGVLNLNQEFLYIVQGVLNKDQGILNVTQEVLNVIQNTFNKIQGILNAVKMHLDGNSSILIFVLVFFCKM